MNELIEKAGLKNDKVAHLGYLFTRNSDGFIHPHAHVIAYSTKDMKTKRQITRIPMLTKINLNEAWRTLVGLPVSALNKPIVTSPVNDSIGLIDYITGSCNMNAPKQHWAFLEPHNLELLERKAIERRTYEIGLRRAV